MKVMRAKSLTTSAAKRSSVSEKLKNNEKNRIQYMRLWYWIFKNTPRQPVQAEFFNSVQLGLGVFNVLTRAGNRPGPEFRIRSRGQETFEQMGGGVTIDGLSARHITVTVHNHRYITDDWQLGCTYEDHFRIWRCSKTHLCEHEKGFDRILSAVGVICVTYRGVNMQITCHRRTYSAGSLGWENANFCRQLNTFMLFVSDESVSLWLMLL